MAGFPACRFEHDNVMHAPVSGAGIIGTGPIGLGCAALLDKRGFKTMIWSPSGTFRGGAPVKSEGALEHAFTPVMAASARRLAEENDVITVTVPAYGHRDVLNAIAGCITSAHAVIISSHVPFASEFLRAAAARRGVEPLIIALSTTVLSGRKSAPERLQISTVRDQVDMAVLPRERADEGLALCRELFGDRFVLRDSMLAIALSNLNPQNHLGIALCNLTRIEKGEKWVQNENVTPAVGRLLERLDEERLNIARALGVKTRDIHQHFSRSFHVPSGPVSEMCAAMAAQGQRGLGPSSIHTRYVLEDVPYGLVPTVWLGRGAGAPAKLHEAGIELFNALYGKDFFAENELMNGLKASVKTDAGLLRLLGV